MTQKVVTYHEIKPADVCRYDGVALGEVMLRFDPFDVPTALAREMRVFQGGGETNVACGLAYTFGLRAAVLTALVDDHIGANIRNQLRAAGVDTEQDHLVQHQERRLALLHRPEGDADERRQLHLRRQGRHPVRHAVLPGAHGGPRAAGGRHRLGRAVRRRRRARLQHRRHLHADLADLGRAGARGRQAGQRARHLRRRRPELPLEGRAEQGPRPRDQPDRSRPTSASWSATTRT